jgi:hypothetical protein
VVELDQERGSRSLNSFAENLRRKHEGEGEPGEWGVEKHGIGAFRGLDMLGFGGRLLESSRGDSGVVRPVEKL